MRGGVTGGVELQLNWSACFVVFIIVYLYWQIQGIF